MSSPPGLGLQRFGVPSSGVRWVSKPKPTVDIQAWHDAGHPHLVRIIRESWSEKRKKHPILVWAVWRFGTAEKCLKVLKNNSVPNLASALNTSWTEKNRFSTFPSNSTPPEMIQNFDPPHKASNWQIPRDPKRDPLSCLRLHSRLRMKGWTDGAGVRGCQVILRLLEQRAISSVSRPVFLEKEPRRFSIAQQSRLTNATDIQDTISIPRTLPRRLPNTCKTPDIVVIWRCLIEAALDRADQHDRRRKGEANVLLAGFPDHDHEAMDYLDSMPPNAERAQHPLIHDWGSTSPVIVASQTTLGSFVRNEGCP
ncbi:hypothetical protein BJ322DRAFT_1024831 [Thelephora terrestris]|uniref:Uncharacterized protein n=1 Tax=Thelephora terrestris TaxID=56493 RepID=A0A9P6H741_9AGAM|nr:hypothetical protein BJ322DRAFT_1024831 [Thelephora terrestris]